MPGGGGGLLSSPKIIFADFQLIAANLCAVFPPDAGGKLPLNTVYDVSSRYDTVQPLLERSEAYQFNECKRSQRILLAAVT
jgi:hypothetical protein